MDLPLPADTLLFATDREFPATCTPADVIGTLAQETANLAGLPHAGENIRLSALQREKEECTYVGQGLAVPHARLAGLKQALVHIARCPQGIPWPDEPAHVIALLVVPEERPELHLQLLSTLIRARLKGRL